MNIKLFIFIKDKKEIKFLYKFNVHLFYKDFLTLCLITLPVHYPLSLSHLIL